MRTPRQTAGLSPCQGVWSEAEDRKALFDGALKICFVRHVFCVSAAEGVRMIIDPAWDSFLHDMCQTNKLQLIL